jgi:type IV secretory pathway TraG/TraD family ATPase VirD4
MTADEVRRIGDDEALVIVSNFKPMRVRRIHWDEPPNPARVGSLGPEHAMVMREPVAPPPPKDTEPLRRGLQRIEEEES